MIPRVPLSFPGICPGCLRPKPETQVRIRSEKAKLKGFYLVATKWQHLWVTVPFCNDCADRRARWEKRDLLLLLVAVIAAFAVAGLLESWLTVGVWFFWAAFLGAAATFTALCNRMVNDQRAVRIRHFNDTTITFSFCHSEYAREFARLNGSAPSF